MMEEDFALEGKKVRIRTFSQADITESYIGWLNDPEVTHFSNQRFKRHDRESCQRYLKTFQDTPNMFVLVEDRERGKAVGTMTAYFQPFHGTVDVGILIGEPTLWGRGYGRDAWCTFVDWLIDLPDIRKVTAGTLSCNAGMQRLCSASSMNYEGSRTRQEIVDGEAFDIQYYGRFAP